jgi:hypothetical protein
MELPKFKEKKKYKSDIFDIGYSTQLQDVLLEKKELIKEDKRTTEFNENSFHFSCLKYGGKENIFTREALEDLRWYVFQNNGSFIATGTVYRFNLCGQPFFKDRSKSYQFSIVFNQPQQMPKILVSYLDLFIFRKHEGPTEAELTDERKKYIYNKICASFMGKEKIYSKNFIDIEEIVEED